MPRLNAHPDEQIRNELRGWCRFYGITQADLARGAGLHKVSLSRIATGDAVPSLTTAIAICEALSHLADDPSRDRIFVEDVFGDDATGALNKRQEKAKEKAKSAARLASLPAEPLIAWLHRYVARDQHEELRRSGIAGITQSRLRGLLDGKLKTLSFDEADAICMDLGTSVSTLYPGV